MILRWRRHYALILLGNNELTAVALQSPAILQKLKTRFEDSAEYEAFLDSATASLSGWHGITKEIILRIKSARKDARTLASNIDEEISSMQFTRYIRETVTVSGGSYSQGSKTHFEQPESTSTTIREVVLEEGIEVEQRVEQKVQGL